MSIPMSNVINGLLCFALGLFLGWQFGKEVPYD